MQKSASENLFIVFLKKNRWALLLLLLALIGALALILSNNISDKTVADSSDEERIATVISGIDGVGTARVVINKKEGEIVSCAVVCTGGDSERVVSDVKALISSLYGIGYNRISVLKLSE